MNDVSRILSARDRVELLCWLTCGSLGAYYLNGDWPAASFHVQAAPLIATLSGLPVRSTGPCPRSRVVPWSMT